MNKLNKKKEKEKRHLRIRAKILGTEKRPRFSVFRSAKHIYVQIIDDKKGETIVAASDLELKQNKKTGKMKKMEIVREVGKMIAQKAKEKNIEKVVFDRGGFKYHGLIKELAEGAKEAGLIF